MVEVRREKVVDGQAFIDRPVGVAVGHLECCDIQTSGGYSIMRCGIGEWQAATIYWTVRTLHRVDKGISSVAQMPVPAGRRVAGGADWMSTKGTENGLFLMETGT
jgi:hypothetical protein